MFNGKQQNRLDGMSMKRNNFNNLNLRYCPDREGSREEGGGRRDPCPNCLALFHLGIWALSLFSVSNRGGGIVILAMPERKIFFCSPGPFPYLKCIDWIKFTKDIKRKTPKLWRNFRAIPAYFPKIWKLKNWMSVAAHHKYSQSSYLSPPLPLALVHFFDAGALFCTENAKLCPILAILLQFTHFLVLFFLVNNT